MSVAVWFPPLDEETLEVIPAGGATTFSTSFGLGVPGAAASYKL